MLNANDSILFLFFYLKSFSGSRESFDEPKDLTQKVREALRKGKEGSHNNDKTSENAENDQSSNTKEADDESVKKRDKV